MTQRNTARSRGLAASWRRWTGVERATVLGTVISALALVLALVAWQWPRQPSADATPAPAPGASRPDPGQPRGVSPTPPATGGESGPAPDFLADDLQPMAGGDKLREIPLEIKDRADYATHAIAIRCPRNGSEPNTEVTYLLSGHYLRFNATVHPYYPPGADARSATYVTALAGKRMPDGSLDILPIQAQQGARPGAPQPLSATVQGTERLILRVQCGDPYGIVMLTNAQLTPAG